MPCSNVWSRRLNAFPLPRLFRSIRPLAYVWHNDALHFARFAPLPLAFLTGIDVQRDAVVENGRRLAKVMRPMISCFGVRAGAASPLL